MNYTINRETLLRAVKLATSVLPRTTPKEILKGVLIQAGKDRLTIKATDMDSVSLSVTVQAEGKDSFEALPAASRMGAVLQEAGCETLSLGKRDDELSVTTDFAETVLKDLDNPGIYPNTVHADPESTITIEASKLYPALKRVVMYCSDQSARYALTGVKFEREEGKLILVATDGKWMGVEEIPCPSCTADTGCRVIPEKAIKLLLSAMKGDDGEVTIGFVGNNVSFAVDGVTLYARLVEGRYPTWREVFPKSHSVKLPLNAGTLLSVTRQAGVMTTDESKGVDYTFDNSLLTLVSCDPVAGKAEIKLPIAYNGKRHHVCFDGQLMAGVLSQWGGDTEFEACFTEKNTVAEFRFPNDFRAVVVPLTRGEK